MPEAYLDESGIHDGAQVCVVAGYFGGRGKWRKFETDWKRLLYQFKVPMEEFHARDLFPKRKGWFFHKWPERDRHQEFLSKIAFTIAKHSKIHPVAVGVFVDDFNSFPEDVRKYFTGAGISSEGELTTTGCPSKPYFLPFMHCLLRCCHYTPRGGKTHFFFGIDRGQFSGYATNLFQQMKSTSKLRPGRQWIDSLGMPAFPLAKETPQLQAADFLVNLTYNYVLGSRAEIESGRPPVPPPLLGRCIQNARDWKEDFFLLNKNNLLTVLEVAREISLNSQAQST